MKRVDSKRQRVEKWLSRAEHRMDEPNPPAELINDINEVRHWLSEPLRVKCPVCKQLEGQRCHDADGLTADFHAEREAAVGLT